jgi:hypothetical protein
MSTRVSMPGMSTKIVLPLSGGWPFFAVNAVAPRFDFSFRVFIRLQHLKR